MKKLPIGIQMFEKLIASGYVYVDKTAYVEKLVRDGEYFFCPDRAGSGKVSF